MARHEGDFRADRHEPLSVEELVRLLGQPGEAQAESREGTIASYLSSSEGGDEAVKKLGGAFADGVLGLTERKLG